MGDNFSDNGFPGDDVIFGQQDMTPDINSLQTKGTSKLLVVLFIVDCSRSMEGDRISAVNAALTEVKYTLEDLKRNNGLDLKISIMSFTSSAKWELQLTDIDEVSLPSLKTRAGLTEYGNAFHELNKVLRKERFMKHTGKVAPPAIMFLTDGGPTDDYESDITELLNNGWFANASRSAILLGDAIYDDEAKKAVERFVKDPESDITDAENSTVIIQKINLMTMHSIVGDPMNKGNAEGEYDAAATDMSSSIDNSVGGNSLPYAGSDTIFQDPFGGIGTDAVGGDPFGDSAVASTGSDPFGGVGTDAAGGDPFGDGGAAMTGPDPFGGAGTDTAGDDPFGNTGTDTADPDPFGGGGGAATPGSDPFGGGGADTTGSDPFRGTGTDIADSDPFGSVGTGTAGGDPFGDVGTAIGNDDPFGGDSASNDSAGSLDPFGSDGGFDPF